MSNPPLVKSEESCKDLRMPPETMDVSPNPLLTNNVPPGYPSQPQKLGGDKNGWARLAPHRSQSHPGSMWIVSLLRIKPVCLCIGGVDGGEPTAVVVAAGRTSAK